MADDDSDDDIVTAEVMAENEDESEDDNIVTVEKITSHKMVRGTMHVRVKLSDETKSRLQKASLIWADFPTEIKNYIKQNKLRGKNWESRRWATRKK